MSEKHDCVHEELIQNQSRKLAKLEEKASYKEKMISDLSKDVREVKKSIEALNNTITDFILKSVDDDNALRELVNKQDNRITALETTNKTLKTVIGIGFTALSVLIATLTFFITTIH